MTSNDGDRGESRYSENRPDADAGGTCSGPAAADAQATNYSAPDPAATGYTPTFEPAARPNLPLPCRFGKYELLEEVARGGMGVVFKARQEVPGGTRFVALKMILAGRLASPEAIRRFHKEIGAALKLDHPHLVPVYDVGEVGGQFYFTMQFSDGGSLQRQLAEGPLPPKVAARLVCQVAGAVQHAHERGVFHRDLKPHNILLAGGGQEPKLTDFGLARTLDSDLSVTGEVMGTPSYMPPEQVRGQHKEVSAASDVYGLGAVLYCLLTGHPPFQSSDPYETMRQVCDAEPVPPRQLNPNIPLDLETVCLKCLQKESRKRYASAAKLADDLERFLRGEGVVARPVGRLERTSRWCRRKPAVAGLLTAFVLSLFGGTAVSVYFAIEADQRARDAGANYRDAREQEQKARDVLGEVSAREKQLQETRDRLEETVARSLLRPLGHSAGPVTDPEIEALWELAGSSDRVRLLFVEQALRGPLTAQQLRNRADSALHAAVRLDPTLRQRIEKQLLTHLSDRPSESRTRMECALIGLALDGGSPEFVRTIARTAPQAMGDIADPTALGPLAEEVAARAPGATAAGKTARRALETMARTNDLRDLPALALAALAPHVGEEEAAAVARLALDVMSKTTDLSVSAALTRVVVALAPRLRTREAVEIVQLVLDMVTESRFLLDRRGLVQIVEALALKLGRAEAGAAVTRALKRIGEAKGWVDPTPLGEAVAALAPRLGAKETAVAVRQAWEGLGTTGAFGGSLSQQALGRAIEMLAPQLEVKDATEVVRLALAAIREKRRGFLDYRLPVGVVRVLAPRLGPAEEVAAARLVLKVTAEPNHPIVVQPLAEVLGVLATNLGPAEAAEGARPARGLKFVLE
jgi:serine/threonine protein kinase